MKYLLYVDVALAALGTAMTVCVSYVCLVFILFKDTEPSIRLGFSSLLVVSACFLILAVSGCVATYGLWKRRPWNWPAQAVLGLLLPCLYLIVYSHLGSA